MSTEKSCPPINTPQKRYLERLQAEVKTKRRDGPIVLYDAQRKIFMTAIAKNGAIVKWTLSSCTDMDDARSQVMSVLKMAEIKAKVDNATNAANEVLANFTDTKH